jgi:hypothetical protein
MSSVQITSVNQRDLYSQLYQTGILQFGLFMVDGKYQPYQLDLGLIPSYPHVLRLLAKTISGMVSSEAAPNQRILCDILSVPAAVLVGQELQIPVVFERAATGSASHDLAGAYDIGHPTSAIVAMPGEKASTLIQRGRTVGLDVQQTVFIFSETSHLDAVVNLENFCVALADAGSITAQQALTITSWLAKKTGPQ